MSFSYTKLGDSCQSQKNCALTSNAKYILPLSRVYYKSITPMIYYPGHESMHGVDANKLFGRGHEPEHTKAYYIKETSIPVHSDHSRTRPVQQRRKHCTACKTRN